jgi:PAS domain S-box-containing protein
MTLRLNLTPRITIVFVLFAATLLAGVGLLSHSNGHSALQAAATAELLAAAIEKETALNEWVEEQTADLVTAANSPALLEGLTGLTAALPNSLAARSARERVVGELEPRTTTLPHTYLVLAVLDPRSGKIIACTDARLEGQSAAREAYFLSGKMAPYVQNPYQSRELNGPAMTIATPLRSTEGHLLGVLAGWINLDEMSAIVRQRTGLRRTDDAFLVNTAGQWVTQPRFISTPVVLKDAVRTAAVQRSLKRYSGFVIAPDYRGVGAVEIYRWLPSRQFALIVKMDESEALAPAYAFSRTILLISGLALLIASALAVALARSVTGPIRALQTGVAGFSHGKLDVRLPEDASDEVGMLAREFNSMAAAISTKEAQLRDQAAQLEERVQERTTQLEASKREVEKTARTNQNLMEYSEDVICSIDETGRFISLNPACQKIWGYAPEELQGQLYMDLVHPDDVEKTIQAATDIMSGHSTTAFENRYLRKDGSIAHMMWSARWSDEEQSMFCVSRDITQRIQAETALRVEVIERKMAVETLREVSRVAEQRKEEAEAANLAKSQFLANMSHEIRTPMNGVLGPIGLLLDSDLNGQQRELVEIARSSAESLLGIINDILDLSKIEVGKLDIEPIPFNLLLAVEETASMMVARAEEKGLDLIVRYPLDVPRHVVGDPGRIRQVLANLVSNAVKFTAHGHVLIDIESVTQTEDEVSVFFKVEDTGIGIAPDKIEHVFGRFNQADTSTTRRYGGTGLGLSISRQLVELMGGEIGAESTLGQGSTFWFTLRLPRQSSEPSITLPDTDLSEVRILIVDDNAINRRVLHEQLNNWHIRSHSCASSEEALEALRSAHAVSDPFQIAILDHQMPDTDGETLGEAIKADPLLRDTVLVMLTSLGRKGDALRLKAAGFAAYLIKPARQSELLGALINVWTARHTEHLPGLVTRHIPPSATSQADLAGQWKGTRVLIAEDNIVNQKVATMILQNFGCRVEVAANGREALKSIEMFPFDIIFMDCEMPEMDGYEATAEIRSRPDEKRNLPIIAVTAKATKGDRERCLEAGMDDYMSKPVKPEDFQTALEKWVPARDEAIPTSFGHPPSSDQQITGPNEPAETSQSSIIEPALDTEVVRHLRSLAEATDASLLNQIFEAFLSDSVERISTLRGALEQGNSELLRKAAHALKGASANVGARRMAEISQELQALGETGTINGALPLVEQLHAEFERVQIQIAAEREGSS